MSLTPSVLPSASHRPFAGLGRALVWAAVLLLSTHCGPATGTSPADDQAMQKESSEAPERRTSASHETTTDQATDPSDDEAAPRSTQALPTGDTDVCGAEEASDSDLPPERAAGESQAAGESRAAETFDGDGSALLKESVRDERRQEADICGAEAATASDLPPRGPEGDFQQGIVSFSLQFRDEVSNYERMSMRALPGEKVILEAIQGIPAAEYSACAEGGTLEREDAARWTWTAPERPGMHRIHVTDETSEDVMTLVAFVQEPYAGQASLNGYKIGSYRTVPLRGLPAYEMPDGMIELSPEDLDTWVSPHFQLRQFVCKQRSDYPKYLIVGERMLLKLERLLEKVNEAGIETHTFAVLSGFRTPWYNAAIGNRTTYSRHLYGDAADIYVDRDRDGRLDDLNGNGREDLGDAKVLHRIVEKAYGQAWYRPYVGGLGLYGPKPHRGGFIHVDTRGYRARW